MQAIIWTNYLVSMRIHLGVSEGHMAAQGCTNLPSHRYCLLRGCSPGRHSLGCRPRTARGLGNGLVPIRSTHPEYVLSTGAGLFENVGTAAVWIAVAGSCMLATYFMSQAFFDARDVVNRRKDRPKLEEELRRQRIEKLFGKK